MGKWGNTGENDRNEGKIKGEDKRGEHRGVENREEGGERKKKVTVRG